MEWKIIQGFENYEVSHTGEVRNIKTQKSLRAGNSNGYRRVSLMKDLKKASLSVHRLVAIAFLENQKETVDHIDGNKANNDISNLRWATGSENQANKVISKNNKSGVKGVYWHKRDEKWVARIWIDGVQVCLGNFDGIEDARKARVSAVQKAFGEFAHVSEI